jgi:hypothetical protein
MMGGASMKAREFARVNQNEVPRCKTNGGEAVL